eukprot:6468128-Amphidinium_carterae.1
MEMELLSRAHTHTHRVPKKGRTSGVGMTIPYTDMSPKSIKDESMHRAMNCNYTAMIYEP